MISVRSNNQTDYLSMNHQWNDREYREAYAEAAIEQGVAWQIKINRKKRNMTRENLAELLNIQKSALSTLEDPERGDYDIKTLIEISKVFDCALSVKFIPYSKLATERLSLSETDQFCPPYSNEIQNTQMTKTKRTWRWHNRKYKDRIMYSTSAWAHWYIGINFGWFGFGIVHEHWGWRIMLGTWHLCIDTKELK